jgi:hypothetical protein
VPNGTAAVIWGGSIVADCPHFGGFSCFAAPKTPASVNLSIFPAPATPFREREVSEWSSRGPTEYGIFKPDLVVPGAAIISAAAGDPADQTVRPPDMSALSNKTGTSMATPVVGGMAALVRQYFAQAKYLEAIDATSALVRAVLVASARPLEGVRPSPDSGFGVPQLDRVFPVANNFGLRVADDRKIGQDERHTYSFAMGDSRAELRVVMAYIDRALSADHEMPLFADLDLFVISPSGRRFTGNDLPDGETEQFNTIERVIVPKQEVEKGIYKVLVQSSRWPEGSAEEIMYSLVVVGPFDHTDVAANPAEPAFVVGGECPLSCGTGTCDEKSGKCVCKDNQYGLTCDRAYAEQAIGQTVWYTLKPGTITHAFVPLGGYDANNKPTLTADLSDPEYEGTFGICLSDRPFPTYAGEPVFCDFPSFFSPSSIQATLTMQGSEENLKKAKVYMGVFAIGPDEVDVALSITKKQESGGATPPVAGDSPGESTAVPRFVTVETSHMTAFITTAITCATLMFVLGIAIGTVFCARRTGDLGADDPNVAVVVP